MKKILTTKEDIIIDKNLVKPSIWKAAVKIFQLDSNATKIVIPKGNAECTVEVGE